MNLPLTLRGTGITDEIKRLRWEKLADKIILPHYKYREVLRLLTNPFAPALIALPA